MNITINNVQLVGSGLTKKIAQQLAQLISQYDAQTAYLVTYQPYHGYYLSRQDQINFKAEGCELEHFEASIKQYFAVKYHNEKLALQLLAQHEKPAVEADHCPVCQGPVLTEYTCRCPADHRTCGKHWWEWRPLMEEYKVPGDGRIHRKIAGYRPWIIQH